MSAEVGGPPPPSPPPPPHSRNLRLLGWVATAESVSFAVLLVGSVLRRTTDIDIVPVIGAVHGTLFIALVLLVLVNRRHLAWGWLWTAAVLTVLSPGAHFPVAAQRRRLAGDAERRRLAGSYRR